MASEKRPDENFNPLDFLSPRLREILRRLAKADRRDEIQELVWVLEAYAGGRLRDVGDEGLSPRIPLEGVPEIHHVESFRIRPGKP